MVLFPLGLVWFVVTLTLWTRPRHADGAAVVLDPGRRRPALVVNGVRGNLVVDTLPEALLAAWSARRPVRGRGLGGQGHGGRPRRDRLALLGPSQSQLQARVEALQASRDQAVDSAEAERRRIERDLHDGAQQRLVALAMDLGMARAKLETDPVAAATPWSARPTRRPSGPWPSCATWPAASTRRCWPTGAWTRPSPPWPPARPSRSGSRSPPGGCPTGRVGRLLRGRRGPHQRGQARRAAEIACASAATGTC